jgi:hypothetical protein
LGSNYTTIPIVYNDAGGKFFSASWRWSPTATLTNELRGGFNMVPVGFLIRGTTPNSI